MDIPTHMVSTIPTSTISTYHIHGKCIPYIGKYLPDVGKYLPDVVHTYPSW